MRYCLTVDERYKACDHEDAYYRVTKERPTSDGCSRGLDRSRDRKRCLEPLDRLNEEVAR